jgi:hypothetical protein
MVDEQQMVNHYHNQPDYFSYSHSQFQNVTANQTNAAFFVLAPESFGGRTGVKSRPLSLTVRNRMVARRPHLLPADVNAHWLTHQPTHSLMNSTVNESNENVISPHRPQLAGQLFSADLQCRLVFGTGSRICPYMPKCGRLWCTSEAHESYAVSPSPGNETHSSTVDFETKLKGLAGLSRSAAGSADGPAGCKTQQMPWADGSACASGRWCVRGQCMPINDSFESKMAINGVWGDWSSWSTCTRSCGGGIQSSVRHCDSPK